MTKHKKQVERKDQILTAAVKLFSTLGYEKTTVDQIAEEAGLSKGAIYWYFKSKLEILFAITDREIASNQQKVVQSTWYKYGAEAFWKVHKDVCVQFEENQDTNTILRQLIELSKRYPEIKEKMIQYYKSWEDVSCELFEWAVKNKNLKKTEYRKLAQVFNALYDGLYMRKMLEPSLDVASIITFATKLMYDALKIDRPLTIKKR